MGIDGPLLAIARRLLGTRCAIGGDIPILCWFWVIDHHFLKILGISREIWRTIDFQLILIKYAGFLLYIVLMARNSIETLEYRAGLNGFWVIFSHGFPKYLLISINSHVIPICR